MASSAEISVVKIPLVEPARSYVIVKTTWSPSPPFRLDVLQLDDDCPSIALAKEFTGELSMDDVETVARKLDVTIDDYLVDLKTVLTTDNGSPKFTYKLEPNRFLWFKNGIMNYGALELRESSIAIDVMLATLQLQIQYKSDFERVAAELEQTLKHHEQMREVYDRFVAESSETEEKNLTKFLALLNTKKARIAQLENLLSGLRGGNDSDDVMMDENNDRNSEAKRRVEVDRAEIPMEAGTSEQTISKKWPRRKNFNKVPATSEPPTENKSATTPMTTSGTRTDNASQNSVYSKDTEEMFDEQM